MARPAAGLLIRAASVWIVEHVGTSQFLTYHTANTKAVTHEFKHPKYYAAFRKQGRKLSSAQAPKLSNQPTQSSSPQAKGSSFKPEVTSSKILEPGYKRTSAGSGAQATRTNEFFG